MWRERTSSHWLKATLPASVRSMWGHCWIQVTIFLALCFTQRALSLSQLLTWWEVHCYSRARFATLQMTHHFDPQFNFFFSVLPLLGHCHSISDLSDATQRPCSLPRPTHLGLVFLLSLHSSHNTSDQISLYSHQNPRPAQLLSLLELLPFIQLHFTSRPGNYTDSVPVPPNPSLLQKICRIWICGILKSVQSQHQLVPEIKKECIKNKVTHCFKNNNDKEDQYHDF